MPCLHPRTVSFDRHGRITYSAKARDKQFVPFQLPCGKCLECRLDYGRQWAVRCVHEAQMHEKNAFITLTYDDDHLGENKLDYRDFQLFMKKLRKLQDDPIGVFVTGEYGEKTKRKHWHALLFGWAPSDGVPAGKSVRGDQYYDSPVLTKLWGKGRCNFGAVTLESAGYCARYAAKKLCHGKDGHAFEPISKKSSKHAIGKKWLEQYWRDVFTHGAVHLSGDRMCNIPRYYEKWLKENKPDEWLSYVSRTKLQKMEASEKKAAAEAAEWNRVRLERISRGNHLWPARPSEIRARILDSKFKLLQDNLKL